MKKLYFTKNIICLTLLYTIFLLNSSIFYIFANNLENSQEVQTQQVTQSEENQESTSDLLDTELEENQEEELQEDDDPLNLTAGSAILVDADTGIILYEKNKDRKVYPASTTKVLTALLTIENKEMTDTITHTAEAFNIGAGSSHIGMRLNETITVEDALHGILLASANEVSMAVAEDIGGTVDNFVSMMNRRAYELGATNTHFANPHGFHDDDHYTTPYDMSLLFKEAISNDVFKQIMGTASYTIPVTNIVDEQRYLHNTNKFISKTSPYYYEDAIGGKTGYTSQAGNTLVSYAEKDGVNLICVVMENSGFNTYVDSKTLFEYGFSMYSDTTLFDKSEYKAKVNVIQEYGENKQAELGDIYISADRNISVKLPNIISKSAIKQVSNITNPLVAPVHIGDSVGTLDFYLNDLMIDSVELVASESMDLVAESLLVREQLIEDLKIGFQKIFKYLVFAIIALLISAPIVYNSAKNFIEKKKYTDKLISLNNNKRVGFNNNNNNNNNYNYNNNNYNYNNNNYSNDNNNNRSYMEDNRNSSVNQNRNNSNNSSRINRINRANQQNQNN